MLFLQIQNMGEKFLQQEKWVAKMVDEGRQEDACDRAEAFGTEGESYTSINIAIDVLNNNLKE